MAESVRVAAAAAGVFVTLAVVLITVAVVNSCAAPTAEEDPGASELLSHLSLLYKGTYVIYGNGVSRPGLRAPWLAEETPFLIAIFLPFVSIPPKFSFETCIKSNKEKSEK